MIDIPWSVSGACDSEPKKLGPSKQSVRMSGLVAPTSAWAVPVRLSHQTNGPSITTSCILIIICGICLHNHIYEIKLWRAALGRSRNVDHVKRLRPASSDCHGAIDLEHRYEIGYAVINVSGDSSRLRAMPVSFLQRTYQFVIIAFGRLVLLLLGLFGRPFFPSWRDRCSSRC